MYQNFAVTEAELCVADTDNTVRIAVLNYTVSFVCNFAEETEYDDG